MTAPHVAETPIHHFALCFLHGNCGVPKNLQIAKYLLLYQLEDERERGIRAPSGVAEEFNKLACCAQCGGGEKVVFAVQVDQILWTRVSVAALDERRCAAQSRLLSHHHALVQNHST